jgi:hypothetical protein
MHVFIHAWTVSRSSVTSVVNAAIVDDDVWPCVCLCVTTGPAISAANGAGWPGNSTPVPGLTVCGDSCMPGEDAGERPGLLGGGGAELCFRCSTTPLFA